MKRNNISMLLLGVTLLLVGGGYLMSQVFGWSVWHLFRGWWTLFLIVPAISSMVETKPNIGNIIVLALGLTLLASSRGWLHGFSFMLMAAILMVVFGGWFVLRAMGIVDKAAPFQPGPGDPVGKSFDSSAFAADNNANPTYAGIFTRKSVRNESVNLMGGTCTSTFGASKVDFSDSIVTHDITIFCNAVFGSTSVIAPRGCRLRFKNLPLLGMVHCGYGGEPETSGLPVVTLDCTAVMGTVEIF